MITPINSKPINFTGINMHNGGREFVEAEGGEEALARLNQAINEFSDIKWNLNVGKNGYSLTSPTTLKTYEGPFSIKKHSKTGVNGTETSQIIVRMDKQNRVKYLVNLPNMQEVRKLYSKIRKTTGFEYMLLILSLLGGKHI